MRRLCRDQRRSTAQAILRLRSAWCRWRPYLVALAGPFIHAWPAGSFKRTFIRCQRRVGRRYPQVGCTSRRTKAAAVRWLGITQERPSSLRLMTTEYLFNGSDPAMATTRPAVKQRVGQSSTRLGGQVDLTIQSARSFTFSILTIRPPTSKGGCDRTFQRNGGYRSVRRLLVSRSQGTIFESCSLVKSK